MIRRQPYASTTRSPCLSLPTSVKHIPLPGAQVSCPQQGAREVRCVRGRVSLIEVMFRVKAKIRIRVRVWVRLNRLTNCGSVRAFSLHHNSTSDALFGGEVSKIGESGSPSTGDVSCCGTCVTCIRQRQETSPTGALRRRQGSPLGTGRFPGWQIISSSPDHVPMTNTSIQTHLRLACGLRCSASG